MESMLRPSHNSSASVSFSLCQSVFEWYVTSLLYSKPASTREIISRWASETSFFNSSCGVTKLTIIRLRYNARLSLAINYASLVVVAVFMV